MLITIVILILLAIYVVVSYNGLVVLRERVKNAWSQVDVQLKRRYDLIPNLINTVKGYVKHEQETFSKVTEARTRAIAASTPEEQGNAENQLTTTLRSLFAVAENYPELKADGNFKDLQQQLSETENKIAYSRQFYNDTVQKYNIKVQVFPTNIIAGIIGFSKEAFFSLDLDSGQREPVEVNFNTEE